ncbi:MAG: DUF2344 domain-containing protein [Streptosporangiales bacterium]|nr:DUF2344 domain-containing protein [Streptosporangiales bacterium]
MRYAKRGRLRFTSHRDIGRAIERALRRAELPVAFSAGFTPHPKISYAGAAPTGVASEAEYLELVVARPCDPLWVRDALDSALPAGIDVLDVALADGTRVNGAAGTGLPDLLEASLWRVRLDGVAPDLAEAAVRAFLAADRIEVERLTKKGRRSLDARAPVVRLEVDRRGEQSRSVPCAILCMVVRNMTPAVRPDDVLTGLRQVASLAPTSPPVVTRLAQGPLDATTGGLADPLDCGKESDALGGGVPSGGSVEDEDVVGALPPR